MTYRPDKSHDVSIAFPVRPILVRLFPVRPFLAHYRTAILSSLMLLSLCGEVVARPPYKQGLKRHFGELLPQPMQACSTCHLTKQQVADPASFDEQAPPHNAFGRRLQELGDDLRARNLPADITTRLHAIGNEDSDGDGVSNEVEILLAHSPGTIDDQPTTEQINAAARVLEEFARTRNGYPWQPFQPVRRPPIPAVDRIEWNGNPIDAFIAAEHEARGLTPQAAASRAVLLRRVTLDLIGLPPTPEELHNFLHDSSPNAYDTVVDRLLASPHYGERWGRHWMDVWRYSDWAGWTGGGQIRDSQPHIWRWRDWIVESLNADKPYDRMIAEMLAADELSPTDPDALRATGFLARNYKMLSRETWMQDTVNHTTQAFLGLTVGCARCHDHMYDSISQDEYYRLRAIFEPHQVRLDRVPTESDTTKDGLARVFDADLEVATYLFRKGDDREPDKERPLTAGVLKLLGDIPYEVKPIPIPPEAYYPALLPHVRKQLLDAAEAEFKAADAEREKAVSDSLAVMKSNAAGPLDTGTSDAARVRAGLAERIAAAAKLRLESIQARIAADTAKFSSPPAANASELAVAASKAEREAAFAQTSIDVAKAELKRLAAIVAQAPDKPELQQAVLDAEKALADANQKRADADKARMEPNAGYTPLGIVYPQQSTGRRAALARWITARNNPLTARVAVNQIWMRHFGQPLVPTVLDFGQNGQSPSHPALVDWLAAELMEPSVATGTSSGPWSMKHLHRLIVTSHTYQMASTPDDKNLANDPDNRWIWRMPSRRMEAELVRDGILFVAGKLDLAFSGPDIDNGLGLSVNRRSLYFRHAQEKQMEFLKLFDCAAVTECYQRKESIVPQQALALANSELTLVQARIIARRLHHSTETDDCAFVEAAFEQVLSRPPTLEESQASVAFLDEQRQKLIAVGERLSQTGGGETDTGKPATDPVLRTRENLVHVLLNHNDFVTIR